MTQNQPDQYYALLQEVKSKVDQIERAVVGAPLEGNAGLVQRTEKLEKRTTFLLWLSPIWIVIGISGGQLLAQIWGIG